MKGEKNIKNKKKIPKILNDFLDYLYVIKGFKINTVLKTKYNLIDFFEFIKCYKGISKDISEFSINELEKIKKTDINIYLVYLIEYKKNALKTCSHKITDIRNLFDWIIKRNQLKNKINPTRYINKIKIEESSPKWFSLKEAKKLINIFTEENNLNYERDNLIIYILLTTGMRVSELINIKVEDINLKEKTILITENKERRERKAIIPDSARIKIQNYIRNNNLQYNMRLINNNYHALSYKTVSKICKKAFKLANISSKDYTIHSFRHTAGTIIYTYSMRNIYVIKDYLGHLNITSTQKYVHISDEILKEISTLNPLSGYNLDKNIKPHVNKKEGRRYKVSAINYEADKLIWVDLKLLDPQVNLILEALRYYIDSYRLFANKQGNEEKINEAFRERLVGDTFDAIIDMQNNARKGYSNSISNT